MNDVAAAPTSPTTRASRLEALHALGSSLAACVPIVFLANVGVLSAPHVRGIGFFPALRYDVVSSVTVAVVVGAAFLYARLAARVARPRTTLAAIAFVLALLLVLGGAALGPQGFVRASLPAAFVVAGAVAWLVPRAVHRTRRSWVARAALALFGLLEVVALAGAVSNERVAPPGPNGMAFDIPRAMFDVDHKFIDLPSGARVHYVDEGQGQTLLFLHGNPAWSFQWRDLIGKLRGSYRCVALDYPGFGLSNAPAGFGFTPREESRVVEEFVDRLGLHDITLVMQDWGGPIGLGFAGRRPELVRAVILGSTWMSPTTTAEARGKFSLIAGGPIGEFAQMNFDGFASFGIRHGVMHELPADVLDVYVRPFLPLDRRGIAAFYPAQIIAAKDYFEEIQAGMPRMKDKPALIFWALLDEGVTRDDLRGFEDAFPDHKTIEFPNANHFFFEDIGDRMVPAMRAFMDGGAKDPAGLPTGAAR